MHFGICFLVAVLLLHFKPSNVTVCLPLQVSWRNSCIPVQRCDGGGDSDPGCLHEGVPQREPIEQASRRPVASYD